VSWDGALDLVAARIGDAIATDGPHSVLPYLYNSSSGALAAGALTPLLFARLGCPEITHTICAATAKAAWDQILGGMLPADPLDVPDARLLVVWGANPTVSNTHLLPLITEAKRSGARLVVIDPRRTGVADRADLFLAVRPGTDVALAYAAARHLRHAGLVDETFCAASASGVEEYLDAAEAWPLARAAEVCGVAAADIATFVETVGTVRPAMLRPGWGLERNRNGGSAWIGALALWVLAGQFGRRGAGVLASTSRAAPLSMGRLAPEGGDAPARRPLSMNDVGALLCGELEGWDVPARVLVVQGANPAASAVDQVTMLRGLARESVFTVVHEQVMTDTAALADVVLPATTHFEAADVAVSYGAYMLQPIDPVIERVGESRTNDELAAGLATRLGFAAMAFDPDPARLLERVIADGGGPGPRRLRAGGSTVQFVDTFPSSGRARLHDPESELPLPRFREIDLAEGAGAYPLTLLSPATARTVNTMFAEFDPPPAVIAISPGDAQARGLGDGDRVRVTGPSAEIELPCRVDPSVRDGVCTIPKGLWRRHVDGALTANAFVSRASSDLARGACFNDARVEVARAG
jgi:anaerobic selenocysteine-containing dehydrogenase